MKASSTFITLAACAAVILFVEVPTIHGQPTKSCPKLFQCMPYMFMIPFKEIANASYYYTGSLMKLSEISDEDWDKQMGILKNLCTIWLDFDRCMDPDWVECIDFNQLASLIEIVNTGAGNKGSGNATRDYERRQQALNNTNTVLTKVGWTVNDTKSALKIATHLCQNGVQAIPYLSCMRNLLLANETIINITIWYQAMLNNSANFECVQPQVTCPKIEKMNQMIGHWLYHGCAKSTEVVVEVVRFIFEGMSFGEQQTCSDVYGGRNARDLFEAPYDRRTEIDFGNDVRKCNFSSVKLASDRIYQKTIAQYFANKSISREEYYHRAGCRLKNISLDTCDYYPYGMPPEMRTTAAVARRTRTRTAAPQTTTTTTQATTTTTEIETTTEQALVQGIAQRLVAVNNEIENTPKPSPTPRSNTRQRPSGRTTRRPKDDDDDADNASVRFAVSSIKVIGLTVLITTFLLI